MFPRPRAFPFPRPASLFLTAIASLVLPAASAADSPRQRLQTFYEQTRALHADFKQRVLGPEGEVQERSRGEVWIKRPDRFRWDYQDPYRQTIVANGETVKFYDPEMEQVTVREYAAGMGHTPSRVLAGSGDLEKHFHVRGEEGGEGLAWILLEPRKPGEAGFKRARIGLSGSPVRVRRLEFTDAFGNRTRIRFSNIRLNPSLDEQRFHFQPPSGTDVLGAGGRNP